MKSESESFWFFEFREENWILERILEFQEFSEYDYKNTRSTNKDYWIVDKKIGVSKIEQPYQEWSSSYYFYSIFPVSQKYIKSEKAYRISLELHHSDVALVVLWRTVRMKKTATFVLGRSWACALEPLVRRKEHNVPTSSPGKKAEIGFLTIKKMWERENI